MRNIVVGIHGDGALQRTNGELGFSLFLQDFAEKNIRTSGCGVQPNGTLKEFFCFVEFLDAGIGVGKFVVGGGIAGIDGQFLFELRGGFGNFGLVEVEFAEKLMGERKFGIELDGFFAVVFGDGAEIEAEQEASGKKVGSSGIWRDLKHFGEGDAGVGIIFGLDVGDAEDIGGVDTGAGIPRLNFFEIGNGFRGLAGEVEGESGELGGFRVVGICCDGSLQRGDGVEVIAFAVVDDAKFMGEIFAAGSDLEISVRAERASSNLP